MKKYLENNFDIKSYVDVADELPIWSAPFGIKLLEFINYRMNITAIDIGFGTGFPLTEIALRLGESSIIYGIDPWKDAIKRVNKKIDYYGLNNVRIIEGIAESIPLDNKTVDLITSNNGINNVKDVEKVLSECSRVIKNGGQFVFTMNTNLTMFEFYLKLEKVLADLNLYKEIELMYQHISHKRPPMEKIISMLKKYGFIIKDLEQDQFNYKFANGTAMLNHYFIRLAFMEPWIKLLPSDKVENIFEIIESHLNKQSELLGELKLSIPFVIINAVKDNS